MPDCPAGQVYRSFSCAIKREAKWNTRGACTRAPRTGFPTGLARPTEWPARRLAVVRLALARRVRGDRVAALVLA